MQRVDPPLVADERTMLDAWLDYHRATLVWKCAGLTDAQLKLRSAEPSTLSLLGLVRHMTEVERSWFRRRIARENAPPLYYSDASRDGDFDDLVVIKNLAPGCADAPRSCRPAPARVS